MPVSDPVDPIENVEHVVSVFRTSGRDKRARMTMLKTILRGAIDYSTTNGAAIGNRRALLCTRLREEELWP